MKYLTETATKMQKKADILGVLAVASLVLAILAHEYLPDPHSEQISIVLLSLVIALSIWGFVVGRKATKYKMCYLKEVMKRYGHDREEQ